MATKYTFIAEDSVTKETVLMSINSDRGTWAEPANLFFRFLKANNFSFNEHNDFIGVMNVETNEFRGPK